MKVFDNIEIFHRGKGANGEAVAVSDKEFQRGLTTIVEAVIPCRLDKEEIISIYNKTRDELPLTEEIAEKECSSSRGFSVGQKAVDLAVLKVIYEDRYSFGYLYWTLVQKYENEPVEIDRFVDPEAPYKKGLIEYAVKYDLTNTVEEYESRSSLDDRYEYILGCLRRSQGEVLVKHRIKEDYEEAVSRLVEECLVEHKNLDQAVLDASSGREPELPAVPESEERSNQRSVGDTPFALNYVIKSENRARLMSYLHERIDGKDKQFALMPVQAAIMAKVLTMPSSTAFNDEFGTSIIDATYYDKIKHSGSGGFKQLLPKLEEMAKELEEMFR